MRSLATLFIALMLAAAAPSRAPLASGPHAFAARDGVQLWYRVAGPAKGIPVIYLHGGPAEGSQGFARTIGPSLEKNLRMVYLDQRGAGHSAKPAEPDRYSMDKIIDDVEQLRQQLGVEKVSVIGHSYGAMVAMKYAVAYPNRVSRLVLAGVAPDFPAAVEAECARLKIEDSAAYARAAAASTPGYPSCIPFVAYDGPAMAQYMMRMMGTSPETMAILEASDKAEHVDLKSPSSEVLADQMFQYRFKDGARLRMPVLIIAGGHDRLTSPGADPSFARSFPKGRLVVYPAAGHFSFVDAMPDFARDVTAFLR